MSIELNKIYCEDCLETMARMDDNSVDCCVTSPPYWGLRDYGVEGQLGLEKTPEEYVAKMVKIFREVRRVIKGTLWLNLGSSYAGSKQGRNADGTVNDKMTPKQKSNHGSLFSRDILPNQSRDGVLSCDTYDIKSEGFQENDRVYSCLNGESLADCPNHQNCIFGKNQQLRQTVLPFLQKDRDKQRLDSVLAFLDAFYLASHPSTNPSLSGNDEAAFSLLNKALAFLLEYHSFSDNEKEFSRMLACISDIFQRLLPSNCHIRDKVLSFLAYNSPFDMYNLTNMYHTFKSKDLINIPFYVAEALRADGWYLRSDVIWNKLNPMPESVTDRPTKAHEYLFMMSKSAKYYYDADAIKEGAQDWGFRDRTQTKYANLKGKEKVDNWLSDVNYMEAGRNKRTVWTIPTQPYKEAHFATYPEKLIEPCVLAGCPKDGTIYDPFMGAGTTAKVALRAQRNFIGSEINPEYCKIAENRIKAELDQYKLNLSTGPDG